MDFPSDDFTVAEFLRHPQRDEWFRDVLRYIHQSKRTEFITPDGDKRYALYSNKSLNRVVDLRKLGTSFSPIAPPDAPILTVTEDPDNLIEKLSWTTVIGNYDQFYIERSPADQSHFAPIAVLSALTRYLVDDDGGFFLLDDGGKFIVEQGLASTLVGAVYGYSYDDVFSTGDGIEYFYRVRGLRNGIYSAWSNVDSGTLPILGGVTIDNFSFSGNTYDVTGTVSFVPGAPAGYKRFSVLVSALKNGIYFNDGRIGYEEVGSPGGGHFVGSGTTFDLPNAKSWGFSTQTFDLFTWIGGSSSANFNT